MKLAIQHGAIEGESVVNGWDAEGAINCVVSVFLKSTREKVYVAAASQHEAWRMAKLICKVAETQDWAGPTNTTVSGILEDWARKWLDIG